jgi:myo-inositol-1(or 4)-monophosphatase
MNTYQSLLEAAKQIAKEAADHIQATRTNEYQISTKSSTTDMVTSIDKSVETFIVQKIRHLYPSHSIIAEEGSDFEGKSDIAWVIDPIDGTTNFIYNFPAYSVSLAVTERETTVAGVVMNLAENSMYWASKDGGAFKDNQTIEVRGPEQISRSLIGTGFGYSPIRRVSQANFLHSIIGEVRDIRRAGAASLDLCYLAEGRLDGYYEAGLKQWDYAAGSLIVTEAGGIVTGITELRPNSDLVVAASNPELADFLRNKLIPWVPFPD